jgi:hypothetical protein
MKWIGHIPGSRSVVPAFLSFSFACPGLRFRFYRRRCVRTILRLSL